MGIPREFHSSIGRSQRQSSFGGILLVIDQSAGQVIFRNTDYCWFSPECSSRSILSWDH